MLHQVAIIPYAQKVLVVCFDLSVSEFIAKKKKMATRTDFHWCILVYVYVSVHLCAPVSSSAWCTACWLYTCACMYVCHFDLAPIGSPAYERLLWSCSNQTTSPEIFCCCSEQITPKQGRKQRRERDKCCFQVILVALDHFTRMFCVDMIKLSVLHSV